MRRVAHKDDGVSTENVEQQFFGKAVAVVLAESGKRQAREMLIESRFVFGQIGQGGRIAQRPRHLGYNTQTLVARGDGIAYKLLPIFQHFLNRKNTMA